MQFLSSLITSQNQSLSSQPVLGYFQEEVNQTLKLNSTAGISTYSEDAGSDDWSSYFMIGGIFCLFLSVCICGIIVEAHKKKKQKSEQQTKLLETTFLQQDFTHTLTTIQSILESSQWVLSTNSKTTSTAKNLLISYTTASRNKLDLIFSLLSTQKQHLQQKIEEEWIAEGHIEIKQDNEILFYMRSSVDNTLLPFGETIDSFYLLQTYSGVFQKEQQILIGTWSLYGSNFEKNSCLNGEFIIQKDKQS